MNRICRVKMNLYCLMVILWGLFFFSSSLQAMVFTVNSTDDPGVGTCAGICTLHDAIADAAASLSIDTITFDTAMDVCDGSSHPIQTVGPLPNVGFGDSIIVPSNNCTVVLDGSGAGMGVNGLTVFGASTIQGIVIQGFSTGAAIRVQNQTTGNPLIDVVGNIIINNRLGTSADGMSATPNGGGIEVLDGNQTITGNLISGNNGVGINMEPSVYRITVTNNFIGTNATGTASLGNGIDGITLGGVVVPPDGSTSFLNINNNLISGNLNGINLGGDSSNVTVTGNKIGTDITGLLPLGNLGQGISLSSGSAYTIDNNVISGNSQDGILISPSNSNVTITGNKIGWGSDGLTTLPNSRNGMTVSGNTVTVGGSTVAARNLILPINENAGILLNNGAFNNRVEGNYIGINANGGISGLVYTNFVIGVFLQQGAHDNTIGGTIAGTENYIAGHSADLLLSDSNSTNNTIVGNRFGILPSNNPGADPTSCYLNPSIFGGVVTNSQAASVTIQNNFFGGYQNNLGAKQGAINFAPPSLDTSPQSGHMITGNHIGLVPLTTANGTIGVAGNNCEVNVGLRATHVVTGLTIANNVFGNIKSAAIALFGHNNTLSGNLIGINEAGTPEPIGSNAPPTTRFDLSNTCYQFNLNDYCFNGNSPGISGIYFIDGSCAPNSSQIISDTSSAFLRGIDGSQNIALVLLEFIPLTLKLNILFDQSNPEVDFSSDASIKTCLSNVFGVATTDLNIDKKVSDWAVGHGSTSDYSFVPVSTTEAVEGITVSPTALVPTPTLEFETINPIGSGILLTGSSNNIVTSTEIQNSVTAILVEGDSSNNIIGYDKTAAIDPSQVNKNRITANGTGIIVNRSSSIGNTIRGNEITANTESGIVLMKGGNAGILPPTVTSANNSSVSGSCQANTLVDVYQDSAGGDEGKAYVGTANCLTDGTFKLTIDSNSLSISTDSNTPTAINALNSDLVITAIQTDSNGNSSEFSQAFNPAPIVPDVSGGGCQLHPLEAVTPTMNHILNFFWVGVVISIGKFKKRLKAYSNEK